MKEKQTYLTELLTREFNSGLTRKEDAQTIICILKDYDIKTENLERDYEFRFEDDFELIK